MKKWIVGGLIALAGANALAVTIRGSPSCGNWIDYKNKGDKLGTIVNERWLVGFLSGMAISEQLDVLPGTDNDSLSLWMDNYCRANPLESVFAGGELLFWELAKKKRLSK